MKKYPAVCRAGKDNYWPATVGSLLLFASTQMFGTAPPGVRKICASLLTCSALLNSDCVLICSSSISCAVNESEISLFAFACSSASIRILSACPWASIRFFSASPLAISALRCASCFALSFCCSAMVTSCLAI